MTDIKQDSEDIPKVDVKSDELSTKDVIFETLSPQQTEEQKQDINLILDIPIDLSVELGRTKMAIK